MKKDSGREGRDYKPIALLALSIVNPKPQTRNPKSPKPLNPKPLNLALNPKAHTVNPKPFHSVGLKARQAQECLAGRFVPFPGFSWV